MASAFKTAKGESAREIIGVGIVDENGTNGVTLEQAAIVMSELQDAQGAPLTGSALTAAAKKWADAVGLTVGSVSGSSIQNDTGPVKPAQEDK